jgi:hypothetical protein
MYRVCGIYEYRAPSSAHKARIGALGVYEFERFQLFFALFDLESQSEEE